MQHNYCEWAGDEGEGCLHRSVGYTIIRKGWYCFTHLVDYLNYSNEVQVVVEDVDA